MNTENVIVEQSSQDNIAESSPTKKLMPVWYRVLWAQDSRVRPFWRFLAALIVALAAMVFAVVTASLVPGSQVLGNVLFRTIWAALMLGGFTLLLYGLDKISADPLAHMGLDVRRRWACELLQGVLIGAAIIVACVAGVALRGELAFSVGIHGLWHTLGLAAAQIWIIATAALAEEVAFRGYPFQRLCESVGAPASTLVFSLAFGMAHLHNPQATRTGFVNTVLIGTLFSIVYLRTRSLWICWGIHFSWNFMLGFVFGLPVSGTTDFAVAVKGSAAGPYWLTGGAYGIEASAVCTAVCLVAAMLLYFYLPKAVGRDWRPSS